MCFCQVITHPLLQVTAVLPSVLYELNSAWFWTTYKWNHVVCILWYLLCSIICERRLCFCDTGSLFFPIANKTLLCGYIIIYLSMLLFIGIWVVPLRDIIAIIYNNIYNSCYKLSWHLFWCSHVYTHMPRKKITESKDIYLFTLSR